jgi:hypothetical protein
MIIRCKDEETPRQMINALLDSMSVGDRVVIDMVFRSDGCIVKIASVRSYVIQHRYNFRTARRGKSIIIARKACKPKNELVELREKIVQCVMTNNNKVVLELIKDILEIG